VLCFSSYYYFTNTIRFIFLYLQNMDQAAVVAPAQQLGQPVNEDDCMNDDLVEKLRILNYETDFCKNFTPNVQHKPLSRSYFMTQAENANAQFFYFTSLATWLMQVCTGKKYDPPGQFDDPTATIANLIQEVKTIDIPQKDIAPNLVRQGWGEAVLSVLLMLADRALLNKHFSFKPIEYPSTGKGNNAVAKPDQGAEVDGDEVEDDNNKNFDEIEDRVGDIARSDDDEGDDEEMFTGIYGASGGKSLAAQQPTETEVSADVWNLEVERVAPMLQTAVVGIEIRDWRARVEGALTLMKAVDSMYPDVRGMLERVGDDLDKSLDRIRKREQTLGQQFVEQVEEYRGKLRRLNTLQDQFNTVSSRVSGFSSELNNVTATLEDVKAKITEYEEKSSDTTPLVKIKEAVAKVRAEIKDMSLRIGVLQHTVLHYALRQQKERKGRQARGIAAAADLNREARESQEKAAANQMTGDDSFGRGGGGGGDGSYTSYDQEYGGDGYSSYPQRGELDFNGYM